MAHPTRLLHKPEDMINLWEKYKKALEVEGQKWQKVQYVGKDGRREADNLKVPLTLEGFKRYCRENIGEVKQYFSNESDMYNDFLEVCARIREEIREDQIIGGLLNMYNPSITQRLNGLTEKQDITVQKPNLPDWMKD